MKGRVLYNIRARGGMNFLDYFGNNVDWRGVVSVFLVISVTSRIRLVLQCK